MAGQSHSVSSGMVAFTSTRSLLRIGYSDSSGFYVSDNLLAFNDAANSDHTRVPEAHGDLASMVYVENLFFFYLHP